MPSVATTPLIVTRPAAMRASASRREQSPVCLGYLFSRTRDAASASCRRDELVVALVLALELQEIVVAAHLAVRIAAAHVRPRLVDRAAALVAIEEATHG